VQQLAEKERDFIGRNHLLKVVLVGLYVVVAAVSVFTAGGHLLVLFQRTTQNANTALFITILLVCLIEGLKFFPTKAALADLRNEVFSESQYHKNAFYFKLILAVIGFGASVWLSITGAKVINEHYKEMKNPVALVSLDSINTRFDAMLKDEAAVVGAASTITWKGKLAGQAPTIISKSSDRKMEIDRMRNVELDSARAENGRRETKWKSETAKSSSWGQGFAGIAELGAVVILFFLGNYEAGARMQVLDASSAAPSTATPTPVAGSRQPIDLKDLAEIIRQEVRAATALPTAQQPTATRQIGFNPSPPPSDPQPQQPTQPPTTWTPPTVATSSNQDEFAITGDESPWLLEMARKNANSNLGAWRSKLNKGEGVPETNQRNIQIWEERLARIEALLEAKRNGPASS